MNGQETPTTAFVISLIAGILDLISGIMYLLTGATFPNGLMGGYYPGMRRMMGGYYGGMMGGYPGSAESLSSFMAFLGVIGIICGIIILIGAFMLYSGRASYGTWGIVILVLSIVGLLGGGGFLIGAILGIVGGILAIQWRPAAATSDEERSG